MAIKLMYITNEPAVAHIAEETGVDRIFVDLEVRGKEERQGHIDSVKSHHTLQDISRIRQTLTRAELLVRSNALFDGSREEIDEIIARGADIVMLPMWGSVDDARRFRDMVGGRARVMLLLETMGGERALDEVLTLDGIDEVLIGLNDLHLQYRLKFMFELLANGKVDELMAKLKAAGKTCGFGGIARLDGGLISGRNILAEHYRLKSDMAILARSFCDAQKVNDLGQIRAIFEEGMNEIRSYEQQLASASPEFFEANHREVVEKVKSIVG